MNYTGETTTYQIQNEPKKPQKKSVFKRLLKWILGIAVFMLICSLVLTMVFGDKINTFLVTELHKQFKTELKVEDFKLNLWSSFPTVSAELQGVSLRDTQGGNLLEAEKLSFKFGLMALLQSKIDIQRVIADAGALYIYLDSKREPNYNVLKSSERETNTQSDIKLDLKEAILRDFELIYINKANEQETRAFLNTASFSGNFDSKRFSMKSIANMESDFIEVAGQRFLAGQDIQYDAVIDVDLKNQIYQFEKVLVILDGNSFELTGDMSMDNKDTNYNLKLQSRKGNLESVIAFFPEEYLENLDGLESSGTFHFDMTVNGTQNLKENPKVDAKVLLRNATLKSPKLVSPIKEVSFTALYSNGKYNNAKSSVLEIDDFKGYFDRELAELDLEIKNFEDPEIDLKLNGKIPVRTIRKFLKNENISKGHGEIEVVDFSIKGDLEDMKSPRTIAKVETSGKFEFDDAGLTISGQKILLDRGDILLKGNKMYAKGLKVEGANSEFILDGSFKNLIPVLVADSLNSKNAELEFRAEIDAEQLDIKKIINVFNTSSDERETKGWHSNISGLLNGHIEANISKVIYDKLNGDDFEGKIIFDQDELTIDGDVETMTGMMNIEGQIDLIEKPVLKARILFDQIDVHQFFHDANNFGQKVISAKNIRGKMDANMTISAFWDENGEFIDKKLRVLSKLSIKDGELKNLKILRDFADFIKVQDLRHIKFTDMENWLEIRNSQIKIPVMFIQNNAVNLKVSGVHSFDHHLKYNIKLNAGQVLMSRIKKHDPSLKPQKAKHKGFNLHYVISGPIDNYKMRRDRDDVLKSFKLSELHKKRIKASMEKDFNGVVIKELEMDDYEEKLSKKEEREIEEEIKEEKLDLQKEEKIFAKEDEEDALVIPEYDDDAVGKEPTILWEKKRKKKEN